MTTRYKALAVYDIQDNVGDQLEKIVHTKRELSKDELRKRLTILDTRLCMAPCTLIMHDFKRHKSQEKEWFSEPFYSAPRGYKLCLCVDANGYEEGYGSYVSVWVYMMWGENDDLLKWPATGKIKVEVESNNRRHRSTAEIELADFEEPVDCGKRSKMAYGEPCFLEHRYLRHNTNKNKMEFKVTFIR